MQPKIPKLKSRYIPVHSNTYCISSEIHWWKKSSPFIYPNVLINLLSYNKEQIDNLRSNSEEELFLLTDSGGFQVISGTCNINWEESLLKQIELGASKIFSLDTPPVKLVPGTLNQFKRMTDIETKRIIKKNFEIACKQSQYLKEKYPEEFKKFCYVAQSITKSDLDYNINLIKEYCGGIDNYINFFPGGIVYTTKTSDLLMITIAARHAYENFIKKGIYVHYLGMGSFNRMICLIRNEISTFDSSSILQATRANMFVNPINLNSYLQISGNDLSGLTKQFCICPVCSKINYHELVKNNELTMIGRHGMAHNLWHLLSINVFLDAIPKKNYTQMVLENFKVNEDVKRCLEFCDYADKNVFEIAYEKYKHFLKKDETKQNTLF